MQRILLPSFIWTLFFTQRPQIPTNIGHFVLLCLKLNVFISLWCQIQWLMIETNRKIAIFLNKTHSGLNFLQYSFKNLQALLQNFKFFKQKNSVS